MKKLVTLVALIAALAPAAGAAAPPPRHAFPAYHGKRWICPEGRNGQIVFDRKVCTVERVTWRGWNK